MTCNIFLDLPGGYKMPALGYGTWQSFDSNLEKALEIALEAGYRHIDTAAAYKNEEIIGKVLERWFAAGKLRREDIFITTKILLQQNSGLHYLDAVEESLKKSLEKLQLNYIDLYLIHFPVCISFKEDGTAVGEPNTDHIAVWKRMEREVYAGRTKTIGLSNFNIKQIDRILNDCQIKPANVQVELHVYMQQKNLVDFCKKNNITVVAYSPLGARGYNKVLEKRGLPTKEIPDLLNNSVVIILAKKYSKSPAQILLRHTIQRGIAAIPKSITESRIRENINIFDFSLNNEDMEQLDNLEMLPSFRICTFDFFKGLENHPEYPF